MDENELMEAFGLEPEVGVQEQEPADPAAEHEGANEQEPAQPAQEEATQGEQNPAVEEEPPAVNEAATLEERRRNAEIRRRNEEEQRGRETQAKIDAAYAAAFKSGLNPYTQKPITSQADYEEYVKAVEREQLEKAGISEDYISRAISNHPIVQQAEAAIRQAEEQQRVARELAGKEALNSELKAISNLDPSIRTVDDLLKMKNASEFNDMVQNGIPLSQAFKLARFDDLTQKKAEAAKQSVRNEVASKGHLIPSSGGAGETVEVPSEEREMFRALMPDISDEEITRQYAAYLKSAK